jgi:hypothetical protein
MAVKRFRFLHDLATAIPPGRDGLIAYFDRALGEVLHIHPRAPSSSDRMKAAILHFLPRIECVAQQHGFRPFAEPSALFRIHELSYVT